MYFLQSVVKQMFCFKLHIKYRNLTDRLSRSDAISLCCHAHARRSEMMNVKEYKRRLLEALLKQMRIRACISKNIFTGNQQSLFVVQLGIPNH